VENTRTETVTLPSVTATPCADGSGKAGALYHDDPSSKSSY